jgi:hypothetical protein
VFFRSRRAAVAEEPPVEDLLARIEELSARNAAQRDPALERELLALRHRAGQRLAGADAEPAYPEPDYDSLDGKSPVEVTAAELTPELLRAGMLRDGCVIVRGLMPRDGAEALAAEVERAAAARESFSAGGGAPEGYYEEFDPGPEWNLWEQRKFVTAGGLWGADSPKLTFDMFNAFERAGLRDVIHRYLGERAAVSLQKCTMRKVEPDSASAWHQDGAFLGDVRALNVWLALSRCGDVAPGLDIVARRLDEIVPAGTPGAIFEWSVSPQVVEEVSGGNGGVVRPIFEPGDAVLLDEMNLHSTAADPAMPNPRYAIECWFFGLSRFPMQYVPLAF